MYPQYTRFIIIRIWIFNGQNLMERKSFCQLNRDAAFLHLDNFPRKFDRSNILLRILTMFFYHLHITNTVRQIGHGYNRQHDDNNGCACNCNESFHGIKISIGCTFLLLNLLVMVYFMFSINSRIRYIHKSGLMGLGMVIEDRQYSPYRLSYSSFITK